MDSDDEEPQLERPSQETLLTQWTAFFADPLLSIPHLRHEAIAGQLGARGLRSLHWRYYFSLLPSPAAASTSSSSTYALFLGRSRAEYAELRDRFLRSPDGGWVADGESEGGTSNVRPGSKSSAYNLDVQVNNPLSQEPTNLWATWFDDLELRRTIRQDVKRTFPEIDYFRQPETQDKMTDLLFIFCKLAPEIGYRQGMHELLAPLLWVVDFDSLVPSPALDSLPHLVLARDYVEHDTWSLFSALMKMARTLYDHTPSVPLPVDRAAASSTTSLTLAHAAGTSSTIVLVQPIVGTAIRIHDKLLQTVDPALWAKMEKLRVEPQLYAIRWLRLLFGREFPIADTLQLWDGLFAEDPSLRLIEYVCVAMLLRIRDALLGSDYSGFISLLLRFPAPADGDQRISLLLQQAIILRDNVSEAAGLRCRQQNISLGATAGVASGDDIDDDRDHRARGYRSRQSAVVNPPMGAAATLLAEGGGFVGDLAKGVYGRAEAMGINKALFGTFSEIRRGVNNASATPRDAFSEIPNRLPWDRPATPVRDYLSEIARLKASNSAMGKAISLCVDVVERELVISKSAPATPASGEDAPPSRAALMAMTALKHVRDVLSGQEAGFDPNVLSPLLHSLEAGVFPDRAPSSPELAVNSLPPALVVPLAQPKPSAAPPSASGMARTLSTESASSSGPSTPPLLPPKLPLNPTLRSSPSPSPSLGHASSTPGAVPSRPIPPWESHRLGQSFARLPESTLSTPPLPRLPPSSAYASPRQPPTAAPRLPPPPARHEIATPPEATFPPTGFSVRNPQGPRVEKKSGTTCVVVDPLGAML